jgi:hypothetical protein
LEADRVAIVAVACLRAGKPRGLIAHLPNRPGFGICRRRRAAAVGQPTVESPVRLSDARRVRGEAADKPSKKPAVSQPVSFL